jgi:16S rRNA (adenine1518-N6/adenine1519-N6)-dimethyltransferase
MAQTKHQIQELLSRAGSGPRKQFGQNFMIDQNLVRLVAEAGEIGANDVVIEVGPGTGTLTEELIARAGKVIAVEIDRDLAAMLREKFSGAEKFALIEGDALAGKHAVNAELLNACHLSGKPAEEGRKPIPSPGIPGEGKGEGSSGIGEVAPESAEPSAQPSPGVPGEGEHAHGRGAVKLVANLPYNIASPLVIELLIAGVELLAFTVQKEVADRLRAGAGSEAYGPLSVMAQMLSEVEVLRTLPPQAFWPPPKIDSSLVRMRRRVHPGLLSNSEHIQAFGRFVAQLFSFRRKTIRKALAQAGYEEVEAVLTSVGVDPQHRPEVLTPEQILKLFQATRR